MYHRRDSLGSSCSSTSSDSASADLRQGQTETLAKLLWDFWDPSFKEAYILPYCNHLAWGDSTISNYELELVVYGNVNYQRAVDELVNTRVPVEKRERCRQNLARRMQQLWEKRIREPLCAFCRNNGEPPNVYQSHVLRDTDGRVACPTLRKYQCPKCGACGDHAHTLKYCPL